MRDPVINNTKGIAWALVSMFFAGSMTVAVRAAGGVIPSTEIVLYRFGVVTLILIALAVLVPYFRDRVSFKKPWMHVIRGGLIAVATHCGFYAITVIPVNTAAVLFFTAPIFASILGVVFHKEAIGPRRIIAIAIGFIGAVIVCEPFSVLGSGNALGYSAALAASLFFALALTMSRGLAEADGVFSTVLSASVIATLISLPVFVGGLSMVADWTTLLIALSFVAIAGLARNVADVEQYHFGEAAIIAPFSYLRLIIVATGAYWLFGELPTIPTLIGGSIIIASTLYIAIRERQLNRAKPTSLP
ncbi:MAG: DMT family transporter [Pseudomonadota bacterium]